MSSTTVRSLRSAADATVTAVAGLAIFTAAVCVWGHVVVNPHPLPFLRAWVPAFADFIIEPIRGISVLVSVAGIWFGLDTATAHLKG